MAWGEIDASTLPSPFLPGNSPEANRTALQEAIIAAQDAGVALYIPPGTYDVWLDPDAASYRTRFLLQGSPIIGAGSSVTVLRFYRPDGWDPATAPGSNPGLVGFFCVADGRVSGTTQVRIEGLTLAIAAQGLDDPKYLCIAVQVEDGTDLCMVDVVTTRIDASTTGWKTAVLAKGNEVKDGHTVYLERCWLKARKEIVVVATPAEMDVSEVTVIDCGLEREDALADGYSGVQIFRGTSLTIVGGWSRGDDVLFSYLIHAESGAAPGRRISIKDHYFAPSEACGVFLRGFEGTTVLIENCTFACKAGMITGGSAVYHVSNSSFLCGNAISDQKDGSEGEAYFTNCQFVCDGRNNLIYRFHNEKEAPWSFSNCTFEDLASAAPCYLVLAFDGTLIFEECRFNATAPDTIPIKQHAGRIELHSCKIDAPNSCWFLSGYLYLHEDPDTHEVTRRSSQRALYAVLEDCVFTGVVISILLQPYAPLFIRGSGNTFAGSIEVAEEDNSLLPPWPSTDPDLIQSDLQLKRARATESDYAFIDPKDPFQTLVGPTKTRDMLWIGWNADWIEIEGAPLPIKNIVMYSNNDGAYEGWAINCPVGTTIHLYAVDAFRLDPGGNIDTLHVRDPGPGHVLTLRYSAGLRMWVPTDRPR